MLTVPEPLPNDPEAVVTALETAEIFGKQGDFKEAVRWVRRAAEIAGDEGSDERALTLARAVADLNISTSQPPKPPAPAPSASAAAPPPPPLPSANAPAAAPPPLPAAGSSAYEASPVDADDDAETRVVDSAKVLAELSAAPPVQTFSPPSNGAAEAAPAPAFAPPDPAPLAVESPAPVEEPAPGSRRVSSMAELLAQKEAEATSAARAAAEALGPSDTSWDDPPPAQPSSPPAQPSAPPVERRTARPDGGRVPTPLIPSQPHTEKPPVYAPLHQAVRASIVATAEPGVFVLRVLTSGQPPAPSAQEVLVVATDPGANPFGPK